MPWTGGKPVARPPFTQSRFGCKGARRRAVISHTAITRLTRTMEGTGTKEKRAPVCRRPLDRDASDSLALARFRSVQAEGRAISRKGRLDELVRHAGGLRALRVVGEVGAGNGRVETGELQRQAVAVHEGRVGRPASGRSRAGAGAVAARAAVAERVVADRGRSLACVASRARRTRQALDEAEARRAGAGRNRAAVGEVSNEVAALNARHVACRSVDGGGVHEAGVAARGGGGDADRPGSRHLQVRDVLLNEVRLFLGADAARVARALGGLARSEEHTSEL